MHKSELKKDTIILKNRRPSRSRILDSRRVKPLDLNYIQVRQAVKIFSSAGHVLKNSNVEQVLLKFPVNNN